MRSILLMVLFIAVFGFCFALLISPYIIPGATNPFGMILPKHIQGTALDAQTQAPLAQAIVTVANKTWGFENNMLVWNKVYPVSMVTDARGRFDVPYRIGTSAHVIVRKVGYRDCSGIYDKNTTVTVRLQQGQNSSHRDSCNR